MEREKIKLKQAVIVEGKYDKIHLSQLVDAVIITTNGFGIYKDSDTAELIRHYAKTTGIIILTDSDSAGNQIRGRIKSIVPEGKIYNAYVPEIFGKEKRKASPSKEGKLGVEGISPKLIIEALERAGIGQDTSQEREKATMTDFINVGLSGGKNSGELRKKLLSQLGLPQSLTARATLDAVNSMMSKDEFLRLAGELFK
ncbi:MAG: DUF4093 domain-containing protein [Oscillospiraceae bacterium]|nr:DUF4093 domain-containing protein [Oscillospiraceae bacterium]